ncbi:serine hydrolase [Streptomyces griseus]|uniref:serine hydrolase domain-containing protein n=1 Tax=Streptomyces griseus TaxID=1911 RepID=UPI0005671F1F|nr:serine hydrolase domain-containing protein [Streptomyces griseus]
MTGRLTPWPGTVVDDPHASGGRATAAVTATDLDGAALGRRLEQAVEAADAPDVVFAVSRCGRRTIRSGGTAPPPPVPRPELRYELGSASKTFTGLLLARLIQRGLLSGGEPAVACLAPGRATGPDPVTLAHLVTHTSGLPSLPRDFFVRSLPVRRTNPYARYPAPCVIDAFLRHRPRHRPGTRWHYSNFGVAVLGHAIAAATGTGWDELLASHLLRPLALSETGTRAQGPGVDAMGHSKDGRAPVPAFDAGGFPAAGAVRATPHDALTFLEAHLDPPGGPLADALLSVRTPVLRRGPGHRHVHTVTWFRHPTGRGPMYFHGGATLGQQAFLGFLPDTGTAVVALCTRRFRAADPFVATAYSLLAEGAEEE